jgi:hypothetical protein
MNPMLTDPTYAAFSRSLRKNVAPVLAAALDRARRRWLVLWSAHGIAVAVYFAALAGGC